MATLSIFRYVLWLLFTAAVMTYGCTRRTQLDDSNGKNIFEPDNRVSVTSMEYPWSTVGWVEGGCTGTLVGRRLVLTAGHCIFDSASGKLKASLSYFTPGFGRIGPGSKVWVDYVWYGGIQPEEHRAKDWAILKLATPSGDTFKWLSVTKVDLDGSLPYTTNLIGYSTDRANGGAVPSVHQGCYIIKRSGERLLHECDSAAGVSGGPMINVFAQKPAIVAMSVSEYRGGAPTSVTRASYDDDHANVAIDTAGFIDVVSYLRKTVDADLPAQPIEGVLEGLNPNVPGTIPLSSGNLPSPGVSPTVTPGTPQVPTPGGGGVPVPSNPMTTLVRADLVAASGPTLESYQEFVGMLSRFIHDDRLDALARQALEACQAMTTQLSQLQLGANGSQDRLSVDEAADLKPVVGAFFNMLNYVQEQLVYDFQFVAYSLALDNQMQRVVNASAPLQAAR